VSTEATEKRGVADEIDHTQTDGETGGARTGQTKHLTVVLVDGGPPWIVSVVKGAAFRVELIREDLARQEKGKV
jgi:hypothetical protein